MGDRCSKQCAVHLSGCRSVAAPTQEEKKHEVVPPCKRCVARKLQNLRDSAFRAGFELGRQSLRARPQTLEASLDKLVKDDFKWVVKFPPEETSLPESQNHISLP